MPPPPLVIPTPGPSAGPDAIIAACAQRRFGVVERGELVALGVSPHQIDRRIADGRLVVLYPRVYAVGHTSLVPAGRRIAAVLACGPGTVMSHRSAADLWGIRPWNVDRYELTIPACRGRHLPGLIVHRAALPADEIVVLDGLPVTTPERTALDTAAVVPDDHMDRALERMIELRIFDAVKLDEVTVRHKGRRGAGRLRRALERLLPDAAASRRELERRALHLVHEHRLPAPQVNVLVDGHEVDLLWPGHRLVVELDSHAFHTSPRAFERDRRKSAELEARGYSVLRFTWAQVTGQPDWVVACIRAVLGRATGTGAAA